MKHRDWRKSRYQSTSLVAIALLVLIIFVSVGYFFSIPEPGPSAQQQLLYMELQANRKAWEEKRPPAYRFVVQRRCDCPLEDMRPFVVNEDLDAIPPGESWIDDLFIAIEAALGNSAQVTVSYDPRFNYPTSNRISYPDAPGEWRQTIIRDFEVVRYD